MLPLDRQPVDFSQTLRELIAPFRSVAEDKAILLAVDIPAELPLVSADEERINQVMHNLLNNALRYTPSAGTITIRARGEDGCLRIEVQDTGEGIAPEHLPNVFERFYRADFARSRQRGGMGLGLAISKAIVEAHGGTIAVSSSGVAGEGTTFSRSSCRLSSQRKSVGVLKPLTPDPSPTQAGRGEKSGGGNQ